MSETINQINRLSICDFAAMAGKPTATARLWAHRYAADLDARRIAGRLSVAEDRARAFLAGEPLARTGQNVAA